MNASAFSYVWATKTASALGFQTALLAMPLVAASALHATALQMGLLLAADALPFPLFGLLAGTLADRLPLRRMLFAANAGRAAGSLLVPALFALHALRLEALYGIAFAIGTLTVIADIAASAMVPALVANDRLVDANSKLFISDSLAQVAGPGITGLAAQAFTAVGALGINAASFALATFAGLLAPDVRAHATPARGGLWSQTADGLRAVFGNEVLRAITICATLWLFCTYALSSLFVLYATRALHLSAGTIGTIFAVAGASYAVGPLVSRRFTRAWGLGPAMIACGGIAAGGWLFTIIMCQLRIAPVASACLGLFIFGFGQSGFTVNSVVIRQALGGREMQGRVMATTRTFSMGAVPLGALAAGLLGERWGLEPTLALFASALCLPIAYLATTSLRRLVRHYA